MNQIAMARVAPEKAVFRPALPKRSLPGSNGTNVVKAIETIYRGYRFRSRLEARWAVFFTSIGIEWQYEAQGFEAHGERYLPDFFLPKHGAWVEVKGDRNAIYADRARMTCVLQAGGPLPLIVLGDVPLCNEQIVYHSCFVRSSEHGLCRTRACFLPLFGDAADIGIFEHMPATDFEVYAMAPLDLLPYVGIEGSDRVNKESSWAVDEIHVGKSGGGFPLLDKAYRDARMARFEHGERG